MAIIFKYDGGEILRGALPGSLVSDEAIQVARELALQHGVVVLEDEDDGVWKVHVCDGGGTNIRRIGEQGQVWSGLDDFCAAINF